MAYDRQHMYLTWGGRIGSDAASPEVWQCGVHLASSSAVGTPALPPLADLEDLYDDTILPYHAHASTAISAGAILMWAKAAALDVDGEYLADPVFYEGTDTPGGGSSDSSGAPQQALAVTLWSGGTFGTANYGRYYLPWSSATVLVATGRIDSTVLAGILTQTDNFLTEINTWAGGRFSTGTGAIRNMSSVGLGTTKAVTTIRLGDVKDTQRRRRNKLAEAYITAAL